MTTEKNRRIDDIRPDAPLQWDDGKSSAPSDGAPRLRLGQIAERLGFPLTADFLRELGFAPVGRERASVLYLESDFQPICAALNRRIASIAPASADNPSTAGAAKGGNTNDYAQYVKRLEAHAMSLLDAATVYAFAYMQDEAEDEDDCVCREEQHERAKAVFAAIKSLDKVLAAPASQAQPSAAEVRDQALEEAIAVVPGGSVCDPQQVADAIRALKGQSALGEKGGEA